MTKQNILEKNYMTFVQFLLLSKQNVISIGTKHKLTAMQSMALLFLGVPQPMNMLTKLFNCDASNITGIIDGLEKKKLASRYENPQDRRIKMVKLESKGAKVRSNLISKLTGDDSYILKKLSDEEAVQFTGLLAKITSD